MQELHFLQGKTLTNTKIYEIKIAGSFSATNNFYEYSDKYSVRLSPIHKKDNITMFSLDINLVNHICTNEKFDYVYGLINLMEKISLTTNTDGDIVEICNAERIKENWEDSRFYLKRKYKNQYRINDHLQKIDEILKNDILLKNFVSQNGCFPIIMSPILIENKLVHDIPDKSKLLIYFLGEFDLPVKEKKEVNKKEDSLELVVKGIIDKEKFDKKPFARWLKEQTDIFNLKVSLELDYEQRYNYVDGILSQAEHYIAAGVMGCFSNIVARTLKEK